MNTKIIRIILCLMFAAATAVAQTSEFTYQGKLNDGGNPANATYEMQFRLYDSANAGEGTQHGSTVTKSAVQVSSGIFNVGLDFGAAPFTAGAERYLEISIRPAGSSGGYTAMAPRQKLTSAPYSVKSLNAVNAETATNAQQLAGVSGNQYVQTNDTRMADARQPLPGSGSYIQNGTTEQAGSNFNISGTGSAKTLSAQQYNLFGFPYLRPSPESTSTIFLGFNAGNSTATGLGNTIIGDSAGNDLTTGTFNTFIGREAGGNTTTGHENIFIGAAAGLDNVTGSNNTAIGGRVMGAVNYATAIGQGVTVGESNAIVIGRTADKVSIQGKLNIGNFTTGAQTPLCLNGANFLVGTCSSSMRYKKDVADYRSGLEIIKQLRPVSFNWKEGNMADIGFVAEEAARVDPRFAIYDRDGGVDGIKYDRIGVVLVNAVKEQQQQIDTQKNENAELQKQVEDLRKELDALRNLIVCRTTMRSEICKEDK